MRVRWIVIIGGALLACSSPDPTPPVGAVNDPTVPRSAPPGGCGFDPAEAFELPSIAGLPDGAYPFTSPTGSMPCRDGHALFSHELLDMTGDRAPDLLVTAACDDPTVGPFAWRVYPNTGKGFDKAFLRFALPLPRPPACATVSRLDVDGDLRPDLLTTSSCIDASVGTSRWIVHRNNGAGFDPPASFRLPAARVLHTFGALRGALECPLGRPRYETFDIDGDRRLDLVITGACEDPSVGQRSWRVYRGGEGGFATEAITFALPAVPGPIAGTAPTYPGHAAEVACDVVGGRTYELRDLDGDWAPELVVTGLCSDRTVGTTRWLVYRNDGAGFGRAPESVALPASAGAGAVPVVGRYRRLEGAAACVEGRTGFSTLDLTRDLRRDIVFTQPCGDPATLARWLVYPNLTETGGPLRFAQVPTSVALPLALVVPPGNHVALASEPTPPACGAGTGRPGYFAAVLDPDVQSLVASASCLDASVGRTKWLVHRSSCR